LNACGGTTNIKGDKMAGPEFETEYIDRADLTESFSDYVEKFLYDGNTLRLELCVLRLDVPNPSKKKGTGKRVPVSRLVLTRGATLDLYNKLHKLVGVLEKQGKIKKRGAVLEAVSKPQKIQ
jgi:hypothetical protein